MKHRDVYAVRGLRSSMCLPVNYASVVRLCLTVGLLSGPAPSQSIAGIWQGTLAGPTPERIVLTVAEGADHQLSCGLDAVDHALKYSVACSYQGAALKVTVPENGASYEGTLAEGGRSITGIWKWHASDKGMQLLLQHSNAQASWLADHTAHKAFFVTVEPGVNLEVLDWGGSGRPLVLLAGLGDNAHVYDSIA